MYVCNPVLMLSNVVQQIRCWTRNEDVWFLVLFLPNFVSTPCYFKLWVKVLIHPGKVLWFVQVALMKTQRLYERWLRLRKHQMSWNSFYGLTWSCKAKPLKVKGELPRENQPHLFPLPGTQASSLSSQAAPSSGDHEFLRSCVGVRHGQEGSGRHCGLSQSLFQAGIKAQAEC